MIQKKQIQTCISAKDLHETYDTNLYQQKEIQKKKLYIDNSTSSLG
jgi:hypothetical protein